MSDLILVENLNAVDLFTKDGVDPILGAIKEEVRKFIPDMTTVKGRKEIASMAHKVAKSKTYLDDLGKKLVEDQKKSIKIVDESRKKIRDELDALKDEVRKPLTEWEEAEEARIAKHKAGVDYIKSFLQAPESHKHANLKLAELGDMSIGPEWEEFEATAKLAKAEALTFLNKEIERLDKLESEQAELKRLREEAAKREQEDRDRKIAEEAALKAKQEAEKKAKEETDRLEQEREIAIKKQKQAEEDARRAEEKRIADAALAEQEKEIAIKRAAEQERKKIQEQKEKEEAEQKKREADLEHKRKINNEALLSLVAIGITEDQAKSVICAIATNQIPHIFIRY